MSNNISFVYKNGYKFLSLLLIVFLTAGFTESCKLEYKTKKLRKKVLSSARKYIGSKYRPGGKSPKGFDCSGFTYFVFDKFDIKLGASSREQARDGKKIRLNKIKEGDLVFFGSRRNINHVGLVSKVSGNELWMIHSSTSQGVVEEEIYTSEYWSNRLLFGRSIL